MLETRLLLGLTTVTRGKNTLSCEYMSEMSLPLKILATKVPPGLSICVVMFSAANINCDCTN